MNIRNFISNHKISLIVIGVCIVAITVFSVLIVRNMQAEPVSQIIEDEQFDEPDFKKKLMKHQYKMQNFKDENGWKRYYDDDGNLISTCGIDISYHQKDIDWDKLKAQGIDFVILRAGYRGYESGDLFVDKNFNDYAQKAQEAGLNIGIYFFSQSVSVEEAVEEAQYTLQLIKDYDIKYPVAYDWEPVEEKKSRTFPVDYPELTDSAIAFCDIIQQAGYTPMIYANRSQALDYYDMERVSHYDLWLAEYFEQPEYPYSFTMWQYTSDGRIDGISGRVDMNICFKKYTD